jgi:ubiquinone/menaquinone biosynthesis C-methylase UbiE
VRLLFVAAYTTFLSFGRSKDNRKLPGAFTHHFRRKTVPTASDSAPENAPRHALHAFAPAAWSGSTVRPQAVLRPHAARMSVEVLSHRPEVFSTSKVPAAPAWVADILQSNPVEHKDFTEDKSVRAWAAWDEDSVGMAAIDGGPLSEVVRGILQDMQRKPSRAGPYYAYHLGRSFFFLSTLSVVNVGLLQPGNGFAAAAVRKILERTSATRELLEALASFKLDYESIASGKYPLPYDMEDVRHRQYNPLKAAANCARFVPEAFATLARRERMEPERVWIDRGDVNSKTLYPDYYETFHYQSDGWMSTKSSEMYEFSTEALFLGKQDAMQRLTLEPLGQFIRTHAARKEGHKLDYLELACGTGRFLTFTLDAFGQQLRPTALDLSPFYLERARENVEYWAKLRGSRSRRCEPVRLIHANAERVPLDDATMDAISAVYLFHEVPTPVLRRIAREIGRILRPGGIFVLTDSVQRGDRSTMNKEVDFFSTMNEPFYRDYFETDLAAIFWEEAGLEPEWKGLRSVTKTLSFRKPFLANAA